MPNDAWDSDGDDTAQYGSAGATGPEPTPAHKAFEANHGETYRPGNRVRVRVRDDPRAREVGTVRSNYNDGGEMFHTVLFEDGTTARYHYDDIVRA